MKYNNEKDRIQMCKVGDQLYRVSKINKTNEFYIEPVVIIFTEFVEGAFGHWYYRDNKNRSYFNRNINKSCYKTKEEAETEILRRQNLIKKRELLKEYERKLNEELNLGNHYIIK